MWKGILGIGGFAAGAGLAGAFIQFSPVSIVILAGLSMGTIGVLIGMVVDERALTWQAVFGLLGFVLGAPLGGTFVWWIVSFRDTFSGGGLAGLFWGVPLGALLGCAIGIWAGSRSAIFSSKRPDEAEPDAAADGGRDDGSS